MPNIEHQPSVVMSVISHYILDVIRHLTTLSAQDTKQFKEGESTSKQINSNLTAPFNLLLISDSACVSDLSIYLTTANPNLKITTLSAQQFLDLPFNHRYHLGCLIDASICNSNILNTTIANDTEISNKHQEFRDIAIRLRDLFAQQSLLFMPVDDNSKFHFNDLGYSLLKLSSEDVSTSLNKNVNTLINNGENNLINCWQFNLYDYKQRPDWLNAKYWANPENFDKYRW